MRYCYPELKVVNLRPPLCKPGVLWDYVPCTRQSRDPVVSTDEYWETVEVNGDMLIHVFISQTIPDVGFWDFAVLFTRTRGVTGLGL